MPRWSRQERELIRQVRNAPGIKELLADAPPFPEAVGESRIVRFLRGHFHDLRKTCEMFLKYLQWRKSAGVDEIRTNIVEGGMDHPLRFQHGELVMSLIPQLPMAPTGLDSFGCPICVETFNFSPGEVLSKIGVEKYIVFMVHCLEFKSIVLEELSHRKEQEWLDSLSPQDREKALREEEEEEEEEREGVKVKEGGTRESSQSDNSQSGYNVSGCSDVEDEKDKESEKDSREDREDRLNERGIYHPYGVLQGLCIIRDLSCVGMAHVSSQGMEILKAIMQVSSDNYPELMRKCYLVNVPWVFNTAWWVIKGWLPQRTAEKMCVLGKGFITHKEWDVPPTVVPSLIGGPYSAFMEYEPYTFNTKLLCPHLHNKHNSNNNNNNNNNDNDTDKESSTININNSPTSDNAAEVAGEAKIELLVVVTEVSRTGDVNIMLPSPSAAAVGINADKAVVADAGDV